MFLSMFCVYLPEHGEHTVYTRSHRCGFILDVGVKSFGALTSTHVDLAEDQCIVDWIVKRRVGYWLNKMEQSRCLTVVISFFGEDIQA
mmetsp:Transcript_5216/g.6942  ORF Transcript_5216/g.6942 Transcript_5216/m.6942 type:complete len:88 (+) Transcript_5216:633-896(+)